MNIKRINDPVGFALSFVWRNARYQRIDWWFVKQNYEDIKQQLCLELLVCEVPFQDLENTEENFRVIMRCLSKAVYNVCRQLGYRRVGGGWWKEEPYNVDSWEDLFQFQEEGYTLWESTMSRGLAD